MQLIFGLAMVLGIGPALLLMYLVVRDYTYPRVEQPFFSDPRFFSLFMVGLVAGSILFFALSMFRFGSNVIYMMILAAIEMMAMMVIMNLKRFRGMSDSVFYGYALGLGISSGLSTGICFTLASVIESIDLSAVTLVVLSVSLSLMLGACGTNVGEGIARNLPLQYTMQGLLPLMVFNMFLTVVLHGGDIGGQVGYYGSMVAMLVIAFIYFHRTMCVKLAGVVRDVLRMEGNNRKDVPK